MDSGTRRCLLPGEYQWELYNLKDDYSQANDLAKMPDKVEANAKSI